MVGQENPIKEMWKREIEDEWERLKVFHHVQCKLEKAMVRQPIQLQAGGQIRGRGN